MTIRKFATITLLVLSSFAANSVSPSKTELEAMYDKAFREFDANNYAEALKGLDVIDARQPDLAESQNLRGVIMMRQAEYPQAEAALQKALAVDPKFWNARFNLAEIPFLQKNWPEARKRFQDLLNGNPSELQGEATQLIQYKILLTYLLEGKENMVESMLAKFELSPDKPAAQYMTAAVALNKKDGEEAKNLLAKAEKNFSPQLNKLFAESLYEIGWLQKPAGQTRAALELNSAADAASKAKAFADAKIAQAEQAFSQRDFTAARKLVDEADAADPNQPRIWNLRGEILLEQKDFDAAEAEFHKALKIDPKMRDAQYNLAQVPFKKKEYTIARDRFEVLFGVTTGADKDQAAQLIKFKIFLTLLLEGKEARAQKMMEQFQFTGDTPALYYAQAATEFKNKNDGKANDWVASARKIYSPAMNSVFSEALYDVGWLQLPAAAGSPAPVVAALDQTLDQTETVPAVEPTPIAVAAANAAVPGMEATTSAAEGSPAASTALAANNAPTAPAPAAALSPSVETPVASTASPAAARPVIASAPAVAMASTTPATVLAPAQVREWSQPSLADRLNDRNTLLVGGLLMAGILLLAGVVIAELRRRISSKPVTAQQAARSTAPAFKGGEAVGALDQLVTPTLLAGGPPQVSLQLRASEPGLRRAVMPPPILGRLSGNGNGAASPASASPVGRFAEPEPYVAPESFDEGVGEPVTISHERELLEPELAVVPAAIGPIEIDEAVAEPQTPSILETAAVAASAQDGVSEPPAAELPDATPTAFVEPIAVSEPAPAQDVAPVVEQPIIPAAEIITLAAAPAVAAERAETAPAAEMPESIVPPVADETVAPEAIEEFEPIGQGAPIPYQITPAAEESVAAETPAAEPERPAKPEPAAPGFRTWLAGIGAVRHPVAAPAPAADSTTNETTPQQPTTPEIMAQPTPPTPAPVIRTAPPTQPMGAAAQPAAGMQPGMQPAAPQPAGGGMHTAVQLTLSFEIASLQLTPNFKMGSLQLRPTSKIVTMRLAPSQHPQPAMNLQVTFEIATVQLSGNSVGMIRLTPSQQQRPPITNTPSFNIAGLQLVSGSEAAPVQLTPAQQGQASVLVTAGFQIATVEFSPSFEIASIILNATSRNVNVQLPGTGPSAIEGAPVFEIAGVQLGGGGEIAMMQLNAPGAAAPAAAGLGAAAARPA